MDDLQINYVDPRQLKQRERNLRKRHPRQLNFLKKSVREYGFIEPVLTRGGNIVHGALRVAAAIELDLETIPAIEISHLSDEQLRACFIATNQIAALAEFDDDALKIELGELVDFEIDLSSLGFDSAELDRLLGITEAEADGRLDQIPEVLDGPSVARLGDLWCLGRHRLYVGDALCSASYSALLGAERAQLIVTDPPFNDRVSTISGNGRVRHREFIQASGELSPDQFTRFLTTACRLMKAYSNDGSLHFIFMSWRGLLSLLRAGNIVYEDLKNIICWVKQNGGMGTLYRSRHELICVFKSGGSPHINNIMLGKHGRNRTNVWDEYGGLSSFQSDRAELLAMHPTVKPVQLIADAILDCSSIDDLVLDPFAGSGTIFLAAEKTRRRAVGMELDPLYADVCLRRFRDAFGIEPVHADSGQTFEECERQTRNSIQGEIHA